MVIYWTILGVAETVVGSLLLCGLGVVQHLSIFCNRSFGDRNSPEHHETTTHLLDKTFAWQRQDLCFL